jgi:hypothetical protein
METKQTAMQELIQWLKIGWKDEDVDTVIKKAEQLLEMEKEQIGDWVQTHWYEEIKGKNYKLYYNKNNEK